MKIEEITLPAVLRAHTASFVNENAKAIEFALRSLEPELRKEIQKLSGLEGSLVKKNFLDAKEAWARYFWAQLAHHLFKQKLDLSVAVLRADEDLIALDSLLNHF